MLQSIPSPPRAGQALAVTQLAPDVDLKARIDAFIAAKKAERAAGGAAAPMQLG